MGLGGGERSDSKLTDFDSSLLSGGLLASKVARCTRCACESWGAAQQAPTPITMLISSHRPIGVCELNNCRRPLLFPMIIQTQNCSSLNSPGRDSHTRWNGDWTAWHFE